MNRSLSCRGWRSLAAVGVAAAILGLALALVLSGCGRKPAAGAGAGAAGEKPSAQAANAGGPIDAARVASCAGFTAGMAAEILGVPAAEIQDQSSDIYDKLRSCAFVSTEDASKQVNFSLRRDDSVEEAADEMDIFRSHLGTAQGAIAGVTGEKAEGAPYEEVSGVGDEAVWAEVNRTFNVRMGNVTIQVAFPEDREIQQRIAQRVVAGLD